MSASTGSRTGAAAYAAVALVDTVLAAGPADRRRWRRVSKPALMPLLVLQTTARPDALGARALGLAQGLSWVGDVALLGRSRSRFLTGLGAFLAAHGAYLAAFWTHSTEPVLASPARRRFLAASGVAVLGVAAAAGRRDRVLVVPVAVYGGALVSMVTAAAAVAPDQGRTRVLAGAGLFLGSDALLGAQQFLVDGDLPLLDAAVMASYTAAQWCLATGLLGSGPPARERWQRATET